MPWMLMLKSQREYFFSQPDRTTLTRHRHNNGGFDLFDDSRDDDRNTNNAHSDASDFIVDIREYDVPYHVRVMIDLGKSFSVLQFLSTKLYMMLATKYLLLQSLLRP